MFSKGRAILLGLPLLIVSGCNWVTLAPRNYLSLYYQDTVQTENFPVCSSRDCASYVMVKLTGIQWQQIEDIMQPAASDAVRERQNIRQAVALLEQLVAPYAGTANDQARNDWLAGYAQLDCVAETLNSTAYLLLLEQQGWLAWHTVAPPRHRGFINLMGPHNTAVVKDNRSGQEYVVDSWFRANGELPDIVPLAQWLSGYDPGDSQ